MFSNLLRIGRVSASYPNISLGCALRPMSRAALSPKLHKFILYAPDSKDSPRFQVRSRHLEEISPLIKSGVVKAAGMMLTPDSIESEDSPVKALGSWIVYEAKSLADAKKMVESDIYYTSGVWDHERLVLLPFLPATPFP